jgi:hypothetical protein
MDAEGFGFVIFSRHTNDIEDAPTIRAATAYHTRR